MKTLFISEHSHKGTGGIENHITHSGKNLEAKGIIVSYLHASELSNVSFLGKKIVLRKNIRNRLLSITPEVIHVHGFSSFFVNQVLSLSKRILPKSKLIYTPCYHPFDYHSFPFLAFLFFHLFLKKNLENIDALIVFSQSEKDFFSQYISNEKINIIPSGITIEDRHREVNDKREDNSLLFVGRNDHNKRLDFLLDQKEYFRRKKIKCYIVTDKQIESDDIFTYYSKITSVQLSDLYEKCSVLAVPSKYESFSIVTLEAMSHGMQVLISDRVQIKSYLYNNDSFNQVFTYDNRNDFQQKLQYLLSLSIENYEESSKKNRSFSKLFDWKIATNKLLDIYTTNKENLNG